MATPTQFRAGYRPVAIPGNPPLQPSILDARGLIPEAAIPPEDGAAVRVAMQAIGGHRVVIASSLTACDYADYSNVSHALRVLGITTAAAVTGAPVYFKGRGEMSFDGWSFTPGGDIWVGADGNLTQAAPAAPAVFSRRIAVAWAPTLILIRFSEPVFF